jgi:hypothetical protein
LTAPEGFARLLEAHFANLNRRRVVRPSGLDYDHAHDALRPVGIFPTSISAQHTLKKADLLCNYIDRLLPCELIGNGGSGVNRFELLDCSGEISPRIRH